MYQHVHLGPSRRADRDNIDRSCSQTQINDVTLEKPEVERKKWTSGEKKHRMNVSKKEGKGVKERSGCTEVGLELRLY